MALYAAFLRHMEGISATMSTECRRVIRLSEMVPICSAWNHVATTLGPIASQQWRPLSPPDDARATLSGPSSGAFSAADTAGRRRGATGSSLGISGGVMG